MNFIEAVAIFESSALTSVSDTLAAEARQIIQATLDAYARQIVQATLDAYDALEPDWSKAPDWAQWYAIDSDGVGYWYGSEPTFQPLDGAWGAPKREYERQHDIDDLLHDIDDLLGVLACQLFLWQRPEA